MQSNTRAAQTSESKRSCLWLVGVMLAAGISACQTEEILVQAPVIVAEFDPTNGVIPTPNDILVDRETGLIISQSMNRHTTRKVRRR